MGTCERNAQQLQYRHSIWKECDFVTVPEAQTIALTLEYELLFGQCGVRFSVMEDARFEEDAEAGRLEPTNDAMCLTRCISSGSEQQIGCKVAPCISKACLARAASRRSRLGVRFCEGREGKQLYSRPGLSRTFEERDFVEQFSDLSFGDSGEVSRTVPTWPGTSVACPADVELQGLEERLGSGEGVQQQRVIDTDGVACCRGRVNISLEDALPVPSCRTFSHNLAEHDGSLFTEAFPFWAERAGVPRVVGCTAHKQETWRVKDWQKHGGVITHTWDMWLEHFHLRHMSQDVSRLGRLHLGTCKALEVLECWNQQDAVEHLRLYVDGSFDEGSQKAGWAVCAVGICKGRWVWIGFFSDRLWGADSAKFLGNDTVNSFVAELTSMACALAVAAAMQGTVTDIVYDSESAAGIASGCYGSSDLSKLAAVTTHLYCFACVKGSIVGFRHTKAHSGDPLNELADRAAKKTIHDDSVCSCDFGLGMVDLVVNGTAAWAWFWSGSEQLWPGFDGDVRRVQDGCMPQPPVLTSRLDDIVVPGVPVGVLGQQRQDDVDAVWHLNVVSYNALTLKEEARRIALAEMFGKDSVHFVGLQEARDDIDGRRKLGDFVCVGSQCVNGQFGCQLWVNSRQPVATREDGDVLMLNPGHAVVMICTPRLLGVVVPAGKVKFFVLVGHAPTAAAVDEDVARFWQEFEDALRSAPRNAIPVLLVDGNARYRVDRYLDSVSCSSPENLNAHCFQRLVQEHELVTQCLRNEHGIDLVTWRSPSGQTACLDYVAVPSVFASELVTIGVPHSFVDLLEIDHLPICVQIGWRAPACSRKKVAMWDRDKMVSAEGRRLLKEIHASSPIIPWDMHVDDHLQIVNEHIYNGLQKHFLLEPCRPRQGYVSDEQWAAIRGRRHARRMLRKTKEIGRKTVLQAYFRAWRNSADWGRLNICCRRIRVSQARIGRVIKQYNRGIRQLARRDVAQGVKTAIRDARLAGPADFSRVICNILKIGRKYRKPSIMPVLQHQGRSVTDHGEFLQVMGEHFAEAERGVAVDLPGLFAGREEHGPCAGGYVDLEGVPDVASLAHGFVSLARKRAAGLSSIPAEAYSSAARHAAMTHLPILVKAMARQTVPSLWKGTQVGCMAKPGKLLGSVKGWRSVALYEASAKGVAKALRRTLLKSFEAVAMEAQCGARKGFPLELPAHHVRAYIQALKLQRRSGGILFLDGRSAYYATLRQHLHGEESLSSPQELESFVQALQPNAELQDQLIAQLLGPGLLQQAGVPSAVREYLRDSMRGSWFCLQPESLRGWQTCSGTVPGTPLADILFQFVQTSFLKNLRRQLGELNLVVTACQRHVQGPAPTWADDVAVLLPPCRACDVELGLREITRVAESCSRSTGVFLNFDDGKTEGMPLLHGEGSVAVRRRLLAEEQPILEVPLTSGDTAHLRLVRSYVHLGGQVDHHGGCLEDVLRGSFL